MGGNARSTDAGGFRGNVNKRNKQKGIDVNSGKISQNIRKA
jgi:hypothetical protein